MSAAFRFPAPTGHAQHDGLATLRHVIAHDVTPLDLDAVKLALHVAPLAYLGAPADHVVTAVNRAVNLLGAAARRLEADVAAQAAGKAARLAKLAALFEESAPDAADDGGSRVPVAPVPPAPPTPDAIHPQLDELAQKLATSTGLGFAEARTLLVNKIRSRQAAQEAA